MVRNLLKGHDGAVAIVTDNKDNEPNPWLHMQFTDVWFSTIDKLQKQADERMNKLLKKLRHKEDADPDDEDPHDKVDEDPDDEEDEDPHDEEDEDPDLKIGYCGLQHPERHAGDIWRYVLSRIATVCKKWQAKVYGSPCYKKNIDPMLVRALSFTAEPDAFSKCKDDCMTKKASVDGRIHVMGQCYQKANGEISCTAFYDKCGNRYNPNAGYYNNSLQCKCGKICYDRDEEGNVMQLLTPNTLVHGYAGGHGMIELPIGCATWSASVLYGQKSLKKPDQLINAICNESFRPFKKERLTQLYKLVQYNFGGERFKVHEGCTCPDESSYLPLSGPEDNIDGPFEALAAPSTKQYVFDELRDIANKLPYVINVIRYWSNRFNPPNPPNPPKKYGTIKMTGPMDEQVTLSNLLFFAENAGTSLDACIAAQQQANTDKTALARLQQLEASYTVGIKTVQRGKRLAAAMYEESIDKMIENAKKQQAKDLKKLYASMEEGNEKGEKRLKSFEQAMLD
jgi:hypothetical protein